MGSSDHAGLGTFEGVFVPTAMTILGVILFVRTGWVVGQVGLVGALLVVVASFLVSTATALSLASIVTNVRVDAGGAFSLLTRTLGIEAGGSIGVPLYLAQTLAIPLYVFGFRSGWLQVFPEHPPLAVDAGLFVVVFAAAAVSARFAFRLQFVVLAVLALAVVSLGAGVAVHPVHTPTAWVTDGAGLIAAFGVFFPAVTGIMAGVNMSGELACPAHSIVRGTLAAIGVTFVVYVAVAVVASLLLPAEQLRDPSTALSDRAFWSPLVLAGILGATFSSALSTAVGSPRILAALGESGVVPGGAWVAGRTSGGEPLRALGVTALITCGGIALRDLNAIAPLITLFFLLTYGAIDATLLVQQGLELPRFRPTFRVPLVVPLVGLIGCGVGMVVVSPGFTVLSVVCVTGLYAFLTRREPEGPYGQVRAGAVLAGLTWVLGRLAQLPGARPWQAHQLVPVRDAASARGLGPLLGTLARRGGSVAFLDAGAGDALDEVVEGLSDDGHTVRRGALPHRALGQGVGEALDVLSASLLSPNLLILPVGSEGAWSVADDIDALVDAVRTRDVGLWLASVPSLRRDDDAFWQPSAWARVEVWVEAELLQEAMAPVGLGLVLLAAWRVRQAHGTEVRLSTVVPDGADADTVGEAEAAAERLRERARIPGASCRLWQGTVEDGLADSPPSLHLMVVRSPTTAHRRIGAWSDASHGPVMVACVAGEASESAA